VGPGAACLLASTRHDVRRQGDNRDFSKVGLGANLLEDFQPIHPWQRNIQQNHVWPVLSNALEGFLPRAVIGDVIEMPENGPQELAIVRVVLYHNNLLHSAVSFLFPELRCRLLQGAFEFREEKPDLGILVLDCEALQPSGKFEKKARAHIPCARPERMNRAPEVLKVVPLQTLTRFFYFCGRMRTE